MLNEQNVRQVRDYIVQMLPQLLHQDPGLATTLEDLLASQRGQPIVSLRQRQAEQQKQIYLRRVTQLFDHIREWFTEEGEGEGEGKGRGGAVSIEETTKEINETLMDDQIRDIYTVPVLVVYAQALPNEPLAEITPKGAAVLGAQGMIDIVGRYGGVEHLMYLQKEGPDLFHLVGNQLIKKSMYENVDTDNWYWVDYRGHCQQLNKATLLEIIMQVSDYDF